MSDDIVKRLTDACNGHPDAKIPWPHRLLHDAIDEIKMLRSQEPGTPLGRLVALSKWAETELGHDPVSAFGFETTIIAAIATERHWVAKLRHSMINLRREYPDHDGGVWEFLDECIAETPHRMPIAGDSRGAGCALGVRGPVPIAGLAK